MSADGPELRELLCRVERLERQNRWLKRAGLAVVAAVGAVLLMGQAAPVPQAIRARRFILEDAHGKTAAELGTFQSPIGGGQGPALRMFDDSGQKAVDLSVVGGRPMFTLEGGSTRAGLRSDGLLFMDTSPGSRQSILATLAGRFGPSLGMAYENQSVLVGAASGGPKISLKDSAGNETALGTTDIVSRTTGETHRTSAASIVMFGNGKNHKVIWQAPEP